MGSYDISLSRKITSLDFSTFTLTACMWTARVEMRLVSHKWCFPGPVRPLIWIPYPGSNLSKLGLCREISSRRREGYGTTVQVHWVGSTLLTGGCTMLGRMMGRRENPSFRTSPITRPMSYEASLQSSSVMAGGHKFHYILRLYIGTAVLESLQKTTPSTPIPTSNLLPLLAILPMYIANPSNYRPNCNVDE